MEKIFVNGINICYESIGEGFPLIGLTGKDSNMDWWHPAIKAALSERNRFIMLDHRGTGRSDAPTEAYDISDMAKDVDRTNGCARYQQGTYFRPIHGGNDCARACNRKLQPRGEISLMLYDLWGQTSTTFLADDQMADAKERCLFPARYAKYALLQNLYSRESGLDRFTRGTDADRAFESEKHGDSS